MLSIGVYDGALQNAFIYQFGHASMLHLVMNSIVILLTFKYVRKVYELEFGEISQSLFIFIAYIGSVISAFISAVDIPTVGASGMIYFMLGEMIALKPNISSVQTIIMIVIAIIVQIVRGSSNVVLHISALILGILFILIHRYCKKQKENRKAAYQ